MRAILTPLALLLSAGAGVGAGFTLHRLDAQHGLLGAAQQAPTDAATDTLPADSATASTNAPPPPSNASAAPAASLAVATTSASASSGAAAPADTNACLVGLFAAGTFEGAPPALDFVCEGGKATKTLEKIRTAIVRAGKNRVSEGMHEWALMGFFQFASLATLRGRCCPSPEKLELAAPPGSCESLGDAMEGLEKSVRDNAGTAGLDAAVGRFDQSVRCALRSKQEKAFGDFGPLGGGEETSFRKTLARATAK